MVRKVARAVAALLIAGGISAAGSDGGATADRGAGGSTLEEIQMGEEAYAQLPPEELAVASARADHYTCALSDAVERMVQHDGIDPATLDEGALLALLAQYAPEALDQAEAQLEGADASPLQYKLIPKPECEEQGCAYALPCQQNYIPSVKHRCFVENCGKSGCGGCPDIVNKLLQNVVVKTWCSYVCVESGTSPPKVVAVGAGGVSALRNIFFGPICVSYP
jgi:hypothetical protein